MNLSQLLRIKNFRWRVERETIDRRRGLGAWFERGCIGTTYGEKGSGEYLSLTFLMLLWAINVRFSWKGNRYKDLY